MIDSSELPADQILEVVERGGASGLFEADSGLGNAPSKCSLAQRAKKVAELACGRCIAEQFDEPKAG